MRTSRLPQVTPRCPLSAVRPRRCVASAAPPWRPAVILDEWVQKEARPISLRQLTFFGRSLTENRLISSANYVRNELPTRLAHRLRDMQTLPFVVVTNPHMSHVYELYYKAFETLRRVLEIKTVEDNDRYCALISKTLQEHLTVIPRLAMGVIECQDMMRPEQLDTFMNTLLKARISRRVIAEQHLALTETFNSPWHFPDAKNQQDPNLDFVGEVFLRCNAREVVADCGERARDLARAAYGPSCVLPDIVLEGHLEATFPYILSHLQYIVGELLRNSIQAVIERQSGQIGALPPIQVLICEAPQHVIIRISDQGGGIPKDILPDLWSFGKGPRNQTRLRNLLQVPKMAATMQELKPFLGGADRVNLDGLKNTRLLDSSLSSLTSRPPNLRLGMGLPMSRVYAEYWAGSLELHSLEGYGCDAFLQISKLGNKNEQLSTRASMDAYSLICTEASQKTMATQVPLGNLTTLSSLMTPSAAGSLSNAPTKHVCGESPGPVRREPDHFYGTFPQRRRPSKSYGDLSNIRPRSPPSYGPHSQHKGLRLSPGKYIEDTPLDFYTDVVSSVQTEQMQIAPSATFVGGKAEAGPLVPPHLEPLDNELALPSKIHRDLPHFRIEGLPRIAWTGVKDVYLPVIQPYISAFDRDSPAMRSLAFVHDAEPVEHIDMCTIWRGLTYIEAHNLFRIHQVFERTISYLVSGQLPDPQWESLAVSRISDGEKANSMPVNHCQRLQLDPQKLASDIASTLASQGRLVGDSAQIPLDRLIDLYLAKSDCLIVNKPDDPHYGAIDVLMKSYKPEAASPSATPLIEAGWYPEYLAFTGLDFRPHEGQELTIIPHYCSNSFSGTLGCHVETRFSLEAPVSWLEWDGRISGWKGIVPVFSEVRDGEDDSIFGKVYRAGRVGPYAIINLLRVEVKAIRIERLGSLCIERTLRARLTIKVLPFWSKGFTPSPQIIPMQSTKAQRVASATQRRFSRVISGCSLLESVLEPSIYVSPRPAIPSERLEIHRKDQRSPSQRFCATQLLASEQSVMRKVRKMNSVDSQDFASTEDSHTKAPAAQQALERFGPPNPRPNPQTDLEAYASSIKLALYGNGTHISGRSVNRQRFSSKCSAGCTSYRNPEHPHNKPSQVWRNLLKDFHRSMASIKKAHPSKDGLVPAAFASAGVPMAATVHAVADGSLRRDITLGSEAHTENHLVFREEIILHPASAEIFALAESLHERPSSQEQIPRKRSRGVSFEDSPVKKTREHVDDDESIGNDPLENTMDDGDVVPATPSCMDEDSSSHSSVSPTVSRNPDELPASRKDSMFGTDTDTEFEDSQENAVSSTHEMDFDSYDDPKLQKEQALLWDILCKKRADGGKDEKLSTDERKQLFEVTKQSWATEESRQSARLGINFSEAFTASSEGLEQSDSENESVSEDSSCFESNPGSDTIHVNVLLDDGMAGPKLTLQKPTDEESEPESGHAEPRTKVRIEDHTTESSLSERNSSDSDEQTESDDDFLASLYRPGTPSPAAGRQTAVRSLRNALSSPSQADRVERSPREVALEKAITLGKSLNERGRTRDRMPLMGLFGSRNRVRDGSTPTRVGGLRKRCSGFGCEEDKENV